MTKINPRVFDTPNLEVKRLDCTLTEAEFNPMNTGDELICELPQPWAELALIYMQGRLNN